MLRRCLISGCTLLARYKQPICFVCIHPYAVKTPTSDSEGEKEENKPNRLTEPVVKERKRKATSTYKKIELAK
jgi:hypothetical protein